MSPSRYFSLLGEEIIFMCEAIYKLKYLTWAKVK